MGSHSLFGHEWGTMWLITTGCPLTNYWEPYSVRMKPTLWTAECRDGRNLVFDTVETLNRPGCSGLRDMWTNESPHYLRLRWAFCRGQSKAPGG